MVAFHFAQKQNKSLFFFSKKERQIPQGNLLLLLIFMLMRLFSINYTSQIDEKIHQCKISLATSGTQKQVALCVTGSCIQ